MQPGVTALPTKIDFQNMQPHSPQNMYVSSANNNNSNSRTNPQPNGLFRGLPPPNNAQRGGNTGSRHVRMQTMFQPTIHPNVVLPTYAQFNPRQPTFSAPQYQYAHGHMPAYYAYISTIQQPQPHQRSGVGVNPGVNNTIPVQSGPNGPLTGPGSNQPQMQQMQQMQSGTVMASAVQPGGNPTVLGVPAAGAAPVGVTSIVGVMPNVAPNQSTIQQTNRRHRQHRLKIIDPNTNKNILDDLDKNLSNTDNDYQDNKLASISKAATVQTETGVVDNSQLDSATGVSVGSGGVIISSDTRNTLPYSSSDINTTLTQRDIGIVNQTPVVSAMSDAPSVEIPPTPQKPKIKKIPNVVTKDETAGKGTMSTDNSRTSQPASTIATETSIPISFESKCQQQEGEENREYKNVSNKYRSAEQETLTHGNLVAPICSEDTSTLTTECPTQQAIQIAQGTISPHNEGIINLVESSELLISSSDAATAVNAITEDPEATPTPLAIESNESPNVNIISVIKSEINCDETDRVIDQFKATSIEIDNNNLIVKDPEMVEEDESTSAVAAPEKAAVIAVGATETKMNINNIERKVKSESKPNAEQTATPQSKPESLPETEPKIAEPVNQSLIDYDDGQWSPFNLTGKKKYNRDQLLQLRNAKASQMQPNAKNVAQIMPSSDLMPSFMRGNNKRVQSMIGTLGGNRGMDGSNSSGNYVGKQASMSGVQGRNSMKGGIYHINLSLNQNVKLNETENAWRPRVLDRSGNEKEADPEREKEELVRRVRGILNKLTPEKFETLMEEIIKLKIDTPSKMEEVMVLVFEKAIDEPNFSVSYAELCNRLISEVKASDERMGKGTKTNLAYFRSALIDKTEYEFKQNVLQSTAKEEKLKPIIEKIRKCSDPNEKAELEAFFEEEERKIRRRSGGTVRFIGELFKISILTGKIINSCIDTLLNPQSEDMLECLCKMLTTVGQKFENTQSPNQSYSLEKTISKMQAIALKTDKDGAKISSRVRFMLQDVIDLRKNKWQSTRNEAPKTMGQIEKETKNEQLSAQYSNYSGTSSGSYANGLQSGPGKRDDRGSSNRYGGGGSDSRSNYGGSHSQRNDSGSLRRQQQSGSGNNNNNSSNGNNDDNTWHVQMGKGSRSQAVDSNKLVGLLNHQDLDTKKMGDVAFFIWNNTHRQQPVANTTTLSNPFAPLSPLSDKNNSNSNSNDRDRNGPRNKGSYNKGSMERDRYGGDRSMHSRTGSSQGSRESSSTRGGQQLRGMMSNSSSLQKTASHSKNQQQQQQQLNSKTSGKMMQPGMPSSGIGLLRSSEASVSDISQYMQKSAAPPAVFKMPSDSDMKTFEKVTLDMIIITINKSNKSIFECMKRIPEAHYCSFVYYILTDYLHLSVVGKQYRSCLGIIIVKLIQNNYLSVEHFKLAYLKFCDIAHELHTDVPCLWLYIAPFTGQMIVKNMISVRDLWLEKLKEKGPSIMGQKFLKSYLTYFTREIGPSFTRNLWKKSNMNWSDYMAYNEVIDFIEKNNFEYIENDKVPPKIEISEDYETYVKGLMEKIVHLLEDGVNASCIIDYCNGNIVNIDKIFIRNLTETLCNFAIVHKNNSYKLNTEVFQKLCIPVLQRYIDLTADRELECLYAMQLLDNSLEHPRDLLSELFGELYDGDVIKPESFIKWRDSKDQSAGKGVAVKGLNPFFNHVLCGETSDENN